MKFSLLMLSLLLTPVISWSEVSNIKADAAIKSKAIADEKNSIKGSSEIIYDSADKVPCKVEDGVRKLRFNPKTGRLSLCR